MYTLKITIPKKFAKEFLNGGDFVAITHGEYQELLRLEKMFKYMKKSKKHGR